MPPVVLRPHSAVSFPDPDVDDEDGLVAIGGDLSVARLLAAYDAGIFPWFSAGHPPLWWCPNPRAILPLQQVHTSRSLRRRLQRPDYRVTWNNAFNEVVAECGAGRSGGTWILPEMAQAYGQLHALGHAHSLEVWIEDRLVGGLYGVQRGGLFAAESMFHRQTDMSKVALVYCAASLKAAGIELFDVQFLTTHLASLGAIEIQRADYLKRVAVQVSRGIAIRALAIISPFHGDQSG